MLRNPYVCWVLIKLILLFVKLFELALLFVKIFELTLFRH